jgi:hypothetical protein
VASFSCISYIGNLNAGRRAQARSPVFVLSSSASTTTFDRAKRLRRRQVAKDFAWNLARLFMYLCFLAIFSINSYYNPYVGLQNDVKVMMADFFIDGGEVPLKGAM